ncbi:ATP-dependent DNA helicase PIF1-like [Saccostrea cucullata]|uniref:ATP-dependent DNA helicase PIF1-like n=1 Tax=Saccostrea cuccullata TaxID=36930 RepID=UPI002ED06A0B
MSAMLNAEQSEALQLVVSGHNCLIHGQAGTSKSFLIKEIVKALKDRAVAVTASTGLAALQFQSATTVHHWAGLRDGRNTNQHLLQVIADETKDRIRTCSLLIIDEISMLEYVCRAVRDPSLYFGGLQSKKVNQ